ncbi:MAG: dATP pyrophosphohydrolase [Alphaproteobacteria bacterium]|nr:dATP pyrophosphohydrolase [Alphaproteobacteria bacterium]
MAVDIIPVSTKAELERFIRVPMRLMANDPAYVAPLMFERREALSPKVNPFFQHADYQFWLARKDGRDVGRISAQIDHLAKTDPDAGYFGMIAAEDDPEVFAALFAVAEDWLRQRGYKKALGPFNLATSEEVGLLVDGFDTPPMLMMGHDPRWTAARIEALGYAKAKDVYAYINSEGFRFSDRVERRLARGLGKGVVLRQVRMNRFDEEVKILADIVNDAWSENWGGLSLTEAETKHLGESLKLILIPEWIWFYEIDGEPAAFIVLLPDINEAIFDLKGKLLPFGWAKMLWRLKVKGVTRARVPLMGVRKKFGRDPRGMMAPFFLSDALRREAYKRGVKQAEYSWVLEDNAPMRHMAEGLNARIYKTYRLYSKTL